jgi:hypothetical protein
MNTFYESTLVEQPMSNRIESNDEDYAVHPLGTFASSGVGFSLLRRAQWIDLFIDEFRIRCLGYCSLL